MATYDYDIGIVGGGAAGLTVASGAAQLGAKTLLVEKEKELGGDCLHYGCVPSKTLIRTARVRHLMARASRFGLPGVALPPVDFREVSRRIRDVIAEIQKHDSAERFCGLGAKVEFGSPAFVDEHAVRLNGRTVSARTWVIATGSSPLSPPVPGLDETPYLTNRGIFSMDRLPASLAVIGGGPIAVEMAQAFVRLGTTVTVLERGSQILAAEDRSMAEAVMAVLAEEGVRFHLDARVESVRTVGGGREVRFSSGGRRRSVRAEELLVAAGRRPNVEGLELGKAGVRVTDRGIPVNSQMKTSQRHIYAAGDVTGAYLFTHAAGYEGGIVVSNAVFRLPRRANYRWFPWVTYTDPELASVGMNEKRAREAGHDCRVIEESFAANDRALAEGETRGRIRIVLDGRERPLGVQILGPHAGELIGEWVAALNGGLKLVTLAGAVHPYPTLGEISKKAPAALLSEKLFSERVRKGLRFFFNLKGRACSLPEEDGT